MTVPTTYPTRPWIPAQDSFQDQPAVLRALPQQLSTQLSTVPDRPSRLLFVGIGASHAAAASGVHRMRSMGIDATRHLPGELAGVTDSDLVIATSQSGRSAEVVDLVKGIDSENVLAVTNYGPSPLGDLAKHHINLGNHSDSSVSFLSYTSTVLAFGMLADHWSGTLDVKNWENIVETALSGFENAKSALDAAAHMITDGPSFVDFVAPAPLASAGEEAALMFREGPLTPATAMETRLYLHGPMDVAGPGAHVIIGGDREALLAKQLGEKTSSVVFIRTDPHVAAPETVATTVDLATTADGAIGQAIEATIMAQYLALKTAEYKRVEIDAPVFTRLDTKTSEAVS